MVDRERLMDGRRVRAGDLLIGLPSAGLHTNGFSLARKVFFDLAGLQVGDMVEELQATVGEILLAEHRCYLAQLRKPLDDDLVHALAHITGGGLTDNLPRVLPDGLQASIERGSWPVAPVFEYIRRVGRVAEEEMFRTYNMGIGMVAMVGAEQAEQFEAGLDALDEPHYRIGEIMEGDRKVRYV
jgi:phosphoribosylformylglycinamidine cyclo-ligase